MKTRYEIKLAPLLLLFIPWLICSLSSCENDFLNAKPNKAILVPTDLEHFEALLDNALDVMNRTPYLGEVASDDFYMADNSYESYNALQRNAYLWSERIYTTPSIPDWDIPYKQIFYANVVLDGLKEGGENIDEKERNVSGAAFFYRAWALFHLSQLFCAPYSPLEAKNDRGVPIRLKSDVTLPSKLGSLQDTYLQMLSDLREAIALLEIKQIVPTRPSKTAAYALMARLHLIMQDYEKANLYADSTLALQSDLLDYNLLDSAKAYPMPVLYRNANKNPEVIFLTMLISNTYLGNNNNTLVDTILYNSYSNSDLRKALFFSPSKQFRGNYIGMGSFQFSGLAVDEIYLIKAEALTRLGKMEEALNTLEVLLAKRWKNGHVLGDEVLPVESEKLLAVILNERRKQLLSRGLRWSDLKRLNQDQRFAKILQRKVGSKWYSLPPKDARYAFPIPDAEIQ